MSKLTYEYLQSMTVDSLREAADAWNKLSRYTSDTSRDLYGFSSQKIGTDVFDGDAAVATRQRTSSVGKSLASASEEAEFISRLLDSAAEGFEDCKNQLGSVVAEIETVGYQVSDRGVVSVPPDLLPDGAAVPPDIQDEAAMWMQEITNVVDRAQDVDDQLSSNLGSLLDTGERNEFDADRVDDTLFGDVLSGDASTDEVHDWWVNLPEETQSDILRQSPETIAWLDGIPSADRHAANMTILEQHVAGNPDDTDAAGLLADIEESGNMLLGFKPAEYVTLSQSDVPDNQVVLKDQEIKTSDWQVIVATGNPDDAENVATFVPGTDSDVSWGNSTEGTKLQIDRTTNLADEANSITGTDDTVSIMWLGYDAPNGVMDEAPDPSRAQDGGADLNQFLEGMESVNSNDDVRQTVLGHSYGSLTAAYGDQAGSDSPADAIVVAGSPGLNDSVDSAEDLNVGEENFYYLNADGDPVPTAPVHGADPSSPRFPGGIELETETTGHSDYYEPDTDDLSAQGQVIVGDLNEDLIYFNSNEKEKSNWSEIGGSHL